MPAKTLPVVSNVLHFNNAGASLMPQPVLNSVIDYLKLESSTGGYEAAELSRDKLASVYDSAAALINCRSDEIAIMENATRCVGYGLLFNSVQARRYNPYCYGGICQQFHCVSASCQKNRGGD